MPPDKRWKGGLTLLSLPDDLHKRLADEFRIGATRMAATTNPDEKLYYFSIFFGEAGRVLNWHWDRELALIWAMTQFMQTQAAARLQANRQGEQVAILRPPFFDALTESAVALADYVEHKGTQQELNQILGRLGELSYVTTGNGFYLLEKGHFKL